MRAALYLSTLALCETWLHVRGIEFSSIQIASGLIVTVLIFFDVLEILRK